MVDRVTRGRGLLEPFLARKRAKMADRLLPPAAHEGRLLDVGCGSHPFFLLGARAAERYGIDRMVGEGGRTLDGVRLVHHDIERDPVLPFESDFFHAVTMLAVFEHIEPGPLAALLAEIRRVLRPGGTLVITTPASWTDPILRTLALLGLVSREEIEEHKDAYDRPRIVGFLTDAGFPPDRIRTGTFELGMNLWASAAA